MNMGGCQLLIMNMAKELISRGNKVIVFCKYIDDIIIDHSPNVSVNAFDTNWKKDSIVKESIRSFQNVNIVTFIWDDYCRLYSLKNYNQKLIFYAVHCDMVKFAAYSNNSILRNVRKAFLGVTIKKLAENKNLVVMDEQTIVHSEAYYGFSFNDAYIIHIPVNVSDAIVDSIEFQNRLKRKERNILAIARADFPFKGYLLGLINALKNEIIPPEYSLTIVSYGKDLNLLIDALNSLDESQKNRVLLLGETPYSDLKELFFSATIYVGMGTTILDASKYGVVSIPVVAYTNDLLCNHFFHDNTEWVAIDNGSSDKIGELIFHYENMSFDERKEAILNCINVVKNSYGIDNSINRLEEVFNNMKIYKDNRIKISYFFRKIKRLLIRGN